MRISRADYTYSVQVRKYESEVDYSAEVEDTFAKFDQGAVKDYRTKRPVSADHNHVEERFLERVAKLYPQLFSGLEEYQATHSNYLDRTIATFDREIQLTSLIWNM